MTTIGVGGTGPGAGGANGAGLDRTVFRDGATGFAGWRIRPRRHGGSRPIPTPAVWGGRVYFGGGFGSHEVYAVDAATGRLAWEYRTTDDGPTASVVHDGLVAFNTESCTLEVVDAATGRRVWHRWLGDPLLGQPALASDRALMVYPSQGRHWLGAFALRMGEELWKVELGHDVITAPVIADGRVYISTFDGRVHCYGLADGARLWSRELKATSAPWVYCGEVFVSQRTEPGRRRRQRRRGAQPAGAAEHQQASGDEGQDVDPGAPDLFDDADFPSQPESPSERTGRWSSREGSFLGAMADKAAPYLAPDWGTDQKASYDELDASVGFSQAPSSAKLNQTSALIGEGRVSRTWRYQGSRPVVLDGILFETTGDRLEARDVATGDLLWSWDEGPDMAGERRLSPPVAANGRVLAGTWDGRIMSWDARTGEVRWQVDVGAPCHWQPVLSGGRVFAGLEDDSLVCFETGDAGDDGWPMWGGGPGHNGNVIEVVEPTNFMA